VARINPDLLGKIMRKLDVGRSRAYAVIDQAVRRTNLPANVAAIVVARDAGVSISRFASDDDWALIRGVENRHPAVRASSSPAVATAVAPVRPVRQSRARTATSKRAKGNKVWVVYGRNEEVRIRAEANGPATA
jgi:hypothetical protein